MDTPITGTIKNASNASGLSERTIYRLIDAGKLETVKVGARHLIVWKSLEALLLQGRRAAA